MNPYVVRHTPLKRACLPVPAHSHFQLSASRLALSDKNYYISVSRICQHNIPIFSKKLSIIIKRTETQLSRLCVFSLLQPHRTEVRLTGKYRYLTFEDRKKIEAWHPQGPRHQLRRHRPDQGQGHLHHRRRSRRPRRDQVGQAQERRGLDLSGLRHETLKPHRKAETRPEIPGGLFLFYRAPHCFNLAAAIL